MNSKPSSSQPPHRGSFVVLALVVSAVALGATTLGSGVGVIAARGLSGQSAFNVIAGVAVAGGAAGVLGGLWLGRRIIGVAASRRQAILSFVLGFAGLAAGIAASALRVGLIIPVIVMLPGAGAAVGHVIGGRDPRDSGDEPEQ